MVRLNAKQRIQKVGGLKTTQFFSHLVSAWLSSRVHQPKQKLSSFKNILSVYSANKEKPAPLPHMTGSHTDIVEGEDYSIICVATVHKSEQVFFTFATPSNEKVV